jgi:hypothetical protein
MDKQLLDVVFPPSNPGLLARAAFCWYRESGADAVFKVVVGRITEVCAIQPLDLEVYAQARKLFCASPVVGR